MSAILQSTIFKGSKNKAAILAAINDPINRELIQQVDSFTSKVESPEGEVLDEVDTQPSENSGEGMSAGMGGGFSGGGFSGGGDFGDFEGEGEEFEGEGSEGEEFEGSEGDLPDTESSDIDDTEEPEIESSTNIEANTYVTAERVYTTVNEIPGTLNLLDTTKGAIQCVLKDNAIWIYYDGEVDINSVLEGVTRTLMSKGYNFLEFDRVVRDKNAIVYTINWVSNYYFPTFVPDNE